MRHFLRGSQFFPLIIWCHQNNSQFLWEYAGYTVVSEQNLDIHSTISSDQGIVTITTQTAVTPFPAALVERESGLSQRIIRCYVVEGNQGESKHSDKVNEAQRDFRTGL